MVTPTPVGLVAPPLKVQLMAWKVSELIMTVVPTEAEPKGQEMSALLMRVPVPVVVEPTSAPISKPFWSGIPSEGFSPEVLVALIKNCQIPSVALVSGVKLMVWMADQVAIIILPSVAFVNASDGSMISEVALLISLTV